MSEQYEEYAAQVYAEVHSQVEDLTAQAVNKPSLIVIVEQHLDDPIEGQTQGVLHPDDWEPALASAYTHVSTLHAAKAMVGSENVVLSLELDQGTLANVIHLIQENDLEVPELYKGVPAFQATVYAMRNGIRLAASDPEGLNPEVSFSDRDDAQIVSLQQLSFEENAEIIIHIGGQAHLRSLDGARVEGNPFDENYADVRYFNTTKLDPLHEALLERERITNPSAGLSSLYNEYATDPENAIQFDPPGKMDLSDEKIFEKVEAAAKEHAEQLNMEERDPVRIESRVPTQKSPAA